MARVERKQGSYKPVSLYVVFGRVGWCTSVTEPELVLLKHVLPIAVTCVALGMAF